MDRTIRILIADDHAVLRAGLRLLLNNEPDMEVVGEATNGQEAVDRTRALQPDILLLDITLPVMDGLEVLAHIRTHAPATKVLMLTMHDDVEYLRRALAGGCAGYVLKRAADSQVLTAIRAVYGGGTYLHPIHARALLDDMVGRSAEAEMQSQEPSLSEREREVIRLVALGYTNRQIADTLFLSVKTVETYRARAMEKLGLKTRAELVRYALNHKLLDIE